MSIFSNEPMFFDPCFLFAASLKQLLSEPPLLSIIYLLLVPFLGATSFLSMTARDSAVEPLRLCATPHPAPCRGFFQHQKEYPRFFLTIWWTMVASESRRMKQTDHYGRIDYDLMDLISSYGHPLFTSTGTLHLLVSMGIIRGFILHCWWFDMLILKSIGSISTYRPLRISCLSDDHVHRKACLGGYGRR